MAILWLMLEWVGLQFVIVVILGEIPCADPGGGRASGPPPVNDTLYRFLSD